jgi:signal transduction histidine kinase
MTTAPEADRSERAGFWSRSIRLWDRFFYVAIALVAVATLVVPGTWKARGLSLTCLALIVLAYTFVGRRVLATGRPRLAHVYLALLVVLTTAQVGWDNIGAVLLFVAYSQIWFFTERRLHGVLWTLALTVGIGVRLGLLAVAQHDNLLGVVGSMAVALLFSIALGLWVTQIAEQNEVQRKLVAQLEAAQDELAATHHAAGVVAERERMAQEIHDTLAQGFTSVVMLAQTTAAELERGHDEAALSRVGQIEQVARQNLAEARALVAAFGPADLADATLAEAIGRLAERFTTQTGVAVMVTPGTADAAAGLARDSQVAILRAAQEALANVRRHAGAGHVTLGLARAGDEVTLEVADDGRGLAADAAEGHGLRGMRERARGAGGTLQVDSTPGVGTTLRLTVPVGVAGDAAPSSSGAAPSSSAAPSSGSASSSGAASSEVQASRTERVAP